MRISPPLADPPTPQWRFSSPASCLSASSEQRRSVTSVTFLPLRPFLSSSTFTICFPCCCKASPEGIVVAESCASSCEGTYTLKVAPRSSFQSCIKVWVFKHTKIVFKSRKCKFSHDLNTACRKYSCFFFGSDYSAGSGVAIVARKRILPSLSRKFT